MSQGFWSSPFGARPLSAALMAGSEAVRRRQATLRTARERGSSETDTGYVGDKWQLLRALTEGRAGFALSDRTIAVLEALLSFHTEKALDGARSIIVFPSNRELSLRARGMAPATLRRHLAALVEAGLILRRDSPNGKRYRRRGRAEDGCDEAFGFDLAPLALKAEEIFQAAAAERARLAVLMRARSAVSLHLRDLRKILEAAILEERAGDWTGFTQRLLALSSPLPRRAEIAAVEAREEALLRLRAEVENAYLETLTEQEMSASEHQSERQFQNSHTEVHFELTGREQKKGAVRPMTSTAAAAEGASKGAPSALARPEAATSDQNGKDRPSETPKPAEAKSGAMDLGVLLETCPQIGAYARQPIRTWRDLITAADLVRGFLGISGDAWARARETMGEAEAAATIAALLERSEAIRSPGGYLRTLTDKAARGRFRVKPMLAALRPSL